MKTEKPYCRLSEAAHELGCTPGDLIEMGAAEKLQLLVCVPDGLRVRIYDDYAKSTHIPIFEPEFLTLSVTHCRKIEIHGKTEQMDFREGFQVDPPGHFKHVIPQYGRPDQNHIWLFWRTCIEELYLPKAIELAPDRLFIRRSELQRLLIAADALPTPELPNTKKKISLTAQPEPSIPEEEAVAQIAKIEEMHCDYKTSVAKASRSVDMAVPAPQASASESIRFSEKISSVAPSQPLAFIRIKQVISRTGLSKSAIYDKLDPKSPRYDQTFPKQRNLGTSSVGWVESEIDAWLASRQVVTR